MRKVFVVIGTMFTFWVLAPAPIYAAYTTLGPDQHSEAALTEPGGILDTLYGLDNLVRIDDHDASIDDRYWTLLDREVTASATLRAKFTGFKHQFGLLPLIGNSNSHANWHSNFKKLLTVFLKMHKFVDTKWSLDHIYL